MGLKDRLQRAWNLFSNRDPTKEYTRTDLGMASYSRPDRVRLAPINERSIIAAVTNRIATDVAQLDIRHVKLDDKKRYIEDIDSDLNECLTVQANKDQTGRAFRQDIAMSIIDEGCIAVVPVDTDDDIHDGNLFKILTMRVAKIVEWYPDHVRIELYNDRNGKREQRTVPKESVAIIENPFYAIMNEPNSTLRRLTRKLNMLDEVDELTSSGKLDIIIQLPYVVKGATKRAEAEKRRKEIERQLTNSKYGIAYTDGTEHITQLNRPAENNLMAQVQYLTDMLFSQLGITQSILDGTADEQTYNNYYDSTIEPIVSAIVDEMKRKFLTKTARTRGQSIMYFRNPFKLMPASKIAEVGGKLITAEVLTKNEVRGLIGFKPSDDPAADELSNPNINKKGEGDNPVPGTEDQIPDEEPINLEKEDDTNVETG
jgi:hypothetical protein